MRSFTSTAETPGEKRKWLLVQWAFYLFLLLLWWNTDSLFHIPPYLFPDLKSVLQAFFKLRFVLVGHLSIALGEAVSGIILSAILGLVIAWFMYQLPFVRKLAYPMLVVSQAIPVIALAPVIIVWFGVGIMPKIMVVTLVCFFPICISTTDGFLSTEKDRLDLMTIMGANRYEIFRLLILPGALPSFFSGLKIAATYSVMGAVIGEWLGARGGLGVFMTRAISSFRTDYLFSAVVLVVVFSILLFQAVELLEKIVIPWHQSQKKP